MFNMCPYGNLLVQLERGIFLKKFYFGKHPMFPKYWRMGQSNGSF